MILKQKFICYETQAIQNKREQLGSYDYKDMIRKEVQAKKSVRWMPWHQEPMKDVTNCDKPRVAVNKRWSGDFRMGEPLQWRTAER